LTLVVLTQAALIFRLRALSGHTTVVHLVAPPLAIWDAQGELWLIPPSAPPPPPGPPDSGPAPGPGDRQRAEVVEAAIQMASLLEPGQQAALVEQAHEQSLQHGELSVWDRLAEHPGLAPAEQP